MKLIAGIGKRIDYQRNKQGMTMIEFLRKAEMYRSGYDKIVNNERCNTDSLDKIAKALEVPRLYLLNPDAILEDMQNSPNKDEVKDLYESALRLNLQQQKDDQEKEVKAILVEKDKQIKLLEELLDQYRNKLS